MSRRLRLKLLHAQAHYYVRMKNEPAQAATMRAILKIVEVIGLPRRKAKGMA